jgi:spermidine synthase
LLIPAVGTSHSAVIVAAISLVLGIVLLWQHPSGMRGASNLFEWLCLGTSALLLATVGDPYYRHLQRRMGSSPDQPIAPYRHVEEASGTTTAFSPTGIGAMDKRLWVNGMGMTDLVMETKLMAHLPISLAENPKDVLVICFGMGTTFRSASRHEQLNIWAVEMMPAVLQCFGFFHSDGPELFNRPNIHAVSDDGRNFLFVRPQQYDVITVDPAPPLYSAGTVNLYSREFFELCRSRLRPGGIMCLWVPPSNYSEVKMILRTFVDVFEHTSVWSGVNFRGLYLLGSQRPFQDVPEKLGKLYEKPAIVADITEWGEECDRPEKFLELHIADGPDLKSFLAETPMITDDHPYTEFPLWRALFGDVEYSRTLDGFVLRNILRPPPPNRDTDE